MEGIDDLISKTKQGKYFLTDVNLPQTELHRALNMRVLSHA